MRPAASSKRWAREQRTPLAEVRDLALSHQPELAAAGCLDDRSFFRLLGCARVESSDVSDWEGADHILDLNLPVPAELRGRFDTVFEAGTLQHVFDLPQVFANLHALVREGGRVIHGMAPSTNHVDHGFYMFSPTLFHDFYTANGWRIEAEYFFEFFPLLVPRPLPLDAVEDPPLHPGLPRCPGLRRFRRHGRWRSSSSRRRSPAPPPTGFPSRATSPAFTSSSRGNR